MFHTGMFDPNINNKLSRIVTSVTFLNNTIFIFSHVNITRFNPFSFLASSPVDLLKVVKGGGAAHDAEILPTYQCKGV